MAIGNPPPVNWSGSTHVVDSGDSLWKIAMEQAEAAAKANKQTLSGSGLTAATARELKVIEQDNPQILDQSKGGSGSYDLIYAGDKIAVRDDKIAGDQPAQTGKPGQTGQTSTPADPKLTAIKTAAAQGNQALVTSLIESYAGNIYNKNAAAGFKTLLGTDWGSSSALVKNALFNAVALNLNNAPPTMGPQGGSSGQVFNTDMLNYMEGYLSALPKDEQKAAADKLNAYQWGNPTYYQSEIKMAKADLGIG
jgi:hypothetical protein